MDTPQYHLDDLGAPQLEARAVEILRAMHGREVLYRSQGEREKERGVRAAIEILWVALTEPEKMLDEPFETRPMDIE